MTTNKKQPCRKNEYQKISFDLKLSIIDEINNGQISANYASKKYGISRGTLAYWIKKLSNFESKSKAMSKNDELKKLDYILLMWYGIDTLRDNQRERLSFI